MLQGPEHTCPVCAAGYTVYLRDVSTLRTRKSIKLYTCLACQSFWNPSGYVEPDRVKQADVKWGIGVDQRNYDAAAKLKAQLEGAGVSTGSVLEVGCGIGTILRCFQDNGSVVHGYDINRFAIAHGREVFGLDLKDEIWTAESDTGPLSVILCISVLEHIEQPRGLLKELCTAAKQHRAALFISVPTLNPPRWHYLHNAAPDVPNTPFFDNDVHVTHFSTRGLDMAMREFGCQTITPMLAPLWWGLLARFDQ